MAVLHGFYCKSKCFDNLKNAVDCLFRMLVKSAKQKFNFVISQPKHMLWVLKRTVSMRRHPKHMLKLMGKKISTILHLNFLFI